jgi:acetyl/propionyl-CoA carboxylase alpha subunit
MVAKLVVSAPDRATALARLDRALAEFAVGGIRTTIPFHRWLLRQPAFVAGRYDTGLLAETLTGDLSLGTDPGAAQVARALAALVACELSAVGRRAACRVAQGKQAMRVELCLAEDGMLQVDAVGARQLLELHARSEAVWSVRDPQSGRQWEATVTRRGRKAVEVAIAGESFSWKVEAEEAS